MSVTDKKPWRPGNLGEELKAIEDKHKKERLFFASMNCLLAVVLIVAAALLGLLADAEAQKVFLIPNDGIGAFLRVVIFSWVCIQVKNFYHYLADEGPR